MVDLICMGEPMVEFNQSETGIFLQGFGGDTSNCAISAARQGASVGYLTCLGQDDFGDKLVNLWQTENIDTSQVARKTDYPTGIYFVTHDDAGHHYTYYRKGSAAAHMQITDFDARYIANAKVLHVSAISQAISPTAAQAVMDAIEIANEHETAVAYDTNLRLNLWREDEAREIIHRAMAKCTVALPSYDDATILTGKQQPDEIVEFYLALGASIVVLKMADKGCLVADGHGKQLIEPRKVSSIDANAAGDTFGGAFLSEWIVTGDTVASANYANAAAAISTTKSGAVASIPNRQETNALISSG